MTLKTIFDDEHLNYFLDGLSEDGIVGENISAYRPTRENYVVYLGNEGTELNGVVNVSADDVQKIIAFATDDERNAYLVKRLFPDGLRMSIDTLKEAGFDLDDFGAEIIKTTPTLYFGGTRLAFSWKVRSVDMDLLYERFPWAFS